MNVKSKTTIGVISGVALAVVVLAYSVTTVPVGQSSIEQKIPDEQKIVLRPPPTLVREYGKQINLTQAEATVPYHIPTIPNPPEGVSLKRVAAGSASKMFVLLYASGEVSDNADVNEVLFNQKGILVRGDPIPPNITEKESLEAYIAASPETRTLISVNGIGAVGVEHDPTIPRPSYIIVYTNQTMYAIAADMPLADLIKLAESMNFRPAPKQ
ncbi:MAG: DUF4367 domain-containing protein [Nitrososphaerales archaeon]